MVNNTNRRRSLVVNSPLQSRFVLSISWPIVACIAATAALLVWFTGRLTTQAFETGVALPAVTPLLVTVLVFLGSAIAYLIWHFLKVSHQVIGPMYRIQRTLESFREGDRQIRIKLRDGDFLGETADHINAFLEWVDSGQPASTNGVEAEGPQGRVEAGAAEEAPEEAALVATEDQPAH